MLETEGVVMKETEEKQTLFDKSIKGLKIFFSIAAYLLLFYVVVTQIVMPDERDDNPFMCRTFEAEWQRVLENGEKIPVEIPAKLDARWG